MTTVGLILKNWLKTIWQRGAGKFGLIRRITQTLPLLITRVHITRGYEKLAWMESKNCQKDEKMLWSQMRKALNMFTLNKRSH